ncbi:MAG: hypothetical protein GY853_05665 [PVC group bacterium]|nr:hypothetical protein [PVC group bacterium]
MKLLLVVFAGCFLVVGCRYDPTKEIRWTDGKPAHMLFEMEPTAYHHASQKCPKGYKVLRFSKMFDSYRTTLVFRCK